MQDQQAPAQTIADKLKARRYDPNQAPTPEPVVMTIQGKTIGTLSNYIVFSGQAKAGKSTFLSAAISSAFVPPFQDTLGIKITPPPGRPVVAYFDTESSRFDFYRQMQRVKDFAGKPMHPRDLHAFTTREDSPKTIRGLIFEYLAQNPQCSVLLVDGFLDLCLNYNDEVETRLLTNWFKRITKEFNILLIGVLHLSKGGGETLGHLGSNTDRWAQSTLIVEKNKETKQFILKPKFLRSADDFEPIALMNFDGKWQQVPYMEPAPIEGTKKRKV